ncbi:MAG: hypothetical protein J0653_03425, partial [Deltaproteobacteria bacterium]|nr:hypothetical protein [Deltaproteobacteria bacterium]
GKAGADLIPLLNGGKKGLQEAADEAKRFGLVLTADAGRQAEEFNDNLTRLKSLSSGVAITIANDLLPQINDIVGKFAKGGDISNGPFMTGLRNAKAEFMRLAMLIDKAGGSMTAAGMLLYGPGAAIGNENSKKQFDRFAGLNVMFDERYQESAKAMQTMANLEVGLDADGNPFKPKAAGGSKGSGAFVPGKSKAAEESVRQQKAADEAIKKLKEQEEAFYNLGQEIEQTSDAAERVFNILANQGGDLKTDRYNVTNPLNYRKPSLLGGEEG